MKKILFFINSLDSGGAERALVNLANHLPKDEYQPTVCTLYCSKKNGFSLGENIEYKYVFKKRGKLYNRMMMIWLCKVLPRKMLYKKIFKDKFDFEIAFLHGFPTELIRSSSNKKSKKLAFVHSDFASNYDIKSLYRSTEECLKSYKQYDKVCFVSETVKDGFCKVVGDSGNGCIVHNVTDSGMIVKKAEQPCENPYIEKDALKLVSVGRLVDLKGFNRLIEAVDRIARNNVSVECVIIGDGPEKDNLKKMIEERGLAKRIKLLGYDENPYKYMKYADVYVCSSLTEGYSTSAVEAVVLGIPIVTTDVSGMDEIIGNSGCGIIVENSVDGIFDGLTMVASDRALVDKMTEAANLRSSYFDTHRQISEFTTILGNLEDRI